MKLYFKIAGYSLFFLLAAACRVQSSNEADPKLLDSFTFIEHAQPVSEDQVVINEGQSVKVGEHVAWLYTNNDFRNYVIVKVIGISANGKRYKIEGNSKTKVVGASVLYKLSKTYKHFANGRKLDLKSGDDIVWLEDGERDFPKDGTFMYARALKALDGTKVESNLDRREGYLMVRVPKILNPNKTVVKWGYYNEVEKFLQ